MVRKAPRKSTAAIPCPAALFKQGLVAGDARVPEEIKEVLDDMGADLAELEDREALAQHGELIVELLCHRCPKAIAAMCAAQKRTRREIEAAEHELYEKVWYERHFLRDHKSKLGLLIPCSERQGIGCEPAERIQQEYGLDPGLYDDFEWGMLSGKLSALRWVLGDEWDFLDT